MICATRSRPDITKQMIKSWKETQSGLSDMVIMLDDDLIRRIDNIKKKCGFSTRYDVLTNLVIGFEESSRREKRRDGF